MSTTCDGLPNDLPSDVLIYNAETGTFCLNGAETTPQESSLFIAMDESVYLGYVRDLSLGLIKHSAVVQNGFVCIPASTIVGYLAEGVVTSQFASVQRALALPIIGQTRGDRANIHIIRAEFKAPYSPIRIPLRQQ